MVELVELQGMMEHGVVLEQADDILLVEDIEVVELFGAERCNGPCVHGDDLEYGRAYREGGEVDGA